MRLRQSLVEEHRLDRCQPDFARHRPRRSRLLPHHPRPARQRLERRMLEDLFGADADPRLARPAHHLDEPIESPPRSKKLSVTPTRATPSTACQIAASVLSTSVCGATYSLSIRVGSGSRFRSTFPLGVRGISASTAEIRRHHERRQRALERCLERLCLDLPLPRHDIPDEPLARVSPRTTTTASRTPPAPGAALRSPQLDPVTPDLHLMIRAPHVLDRAVCAPPRRSTRPSSAWCRCWWCSMPSDPTAR